MNIERLARHLKEFTLDEIEMIAECDCKNEFERLLNTNKIVFEQGVFKIANKNENKFGVFINNADTNSNLTIPHAVKIFIDNYAKCYCSHRTYMKYRAILKFDIMPILEQYNIQIFNYDSIVIIYNSLVVRDFKPLRIKNTMALLKQFLKYCKSEKLLNTYVDFQVKRVSKKNEYSLDRINFT